MEKTGKKISHVTGVLARSVRIIIEIFCVKAEHFRK